MVAAWLDGRPSAPSGSGDAVATVCAHCGLPLGDRAVDGFCCEGCHQVHLALRDTGMLRYYALRGDEPGVPVAAKPDGEEDKWLAVESERLKNCERDEKLAYSVEGMHCAGCVWLLDKVFSDVEARGRIEINPGRGTLDLWVPPTFALTDFARRIGRFGYRLRPLGQEGPASDLLLRMGISVALAMNAMIFAIAGYAGLDEGELYRLFQLLIAALASVSVLVGGAVFFRAALAGIRARVFTLDMPIALGIILGFAGSVVSLLVDGGAHAYFDTLTIFIALMLVGRFLRERVIADNRRRLAEDDDVNRLLVRRATIAGPVEIISVDEVRPGDTLLLLPGDVSPVDARLSETAALLGLEWISGESQPRHASLGDLVESGARNAGNSALRVEALHTWSGSRLARILLTPTADAKDDSPSRRSELEAAVSRVWVPFVLLAASLAFIGHVVAHGDVYRALTVTVALLVVTCPCAFGIATPLGFEIALARLRKEGLLVRSPTFLERAADVRTVAFDKTGTLTTGALSNAESALVALDEAARVALYNIVVRTSHPKAAALLEIVPSADRRFDPHAETVEHVGLGVEASIAGGRYRLGSPAWVGKEGSFDPSRELSFSRDGVWLTDFSLKEELRADAALAIRDLRAQDIDVYILSGDNEERVTAVAERVGVPRDRALASQSPEMKAAFISAHTADRPMMLGDGLNDTLATEAAHCSGTSVEGRSFLASRADFYMLSPGLSPIRSAIRLAKRLRSVVRHNLVLAAIYNTIAVVLSVAGVMSPLVCAVFMPVSSILAIAHTTARLRNP